MHIGITELRTAISEVVDQIITHESSAIITKYGIDVAAIIHIKDYKILKSIKNVLEKDVVQKKLVVQKPLIPDDKKFFNLQEAAFYLGHSTTWLYSQLNNKLIQTEQIGKRNFITREELIRFHRLQQDEENDAIVGLSQHDNQDYEKVKLVENSTGIEYKSPPGLIQEIPADRKFFNLKEVSSILGHSTAWLNNQIKKEFIRTEQVGRKLLITREELIRFSRVLKQQEEGN